MKPEALEPEDVVAAERPGAIARVKRRSSDNLACRRGTPWTGLRHVAMTGCEKKQCGSGSDRSHVRLSHESYTAHRSGDGVDAVRWFVGSPVRLDAADVGDASAASTSRLKMGHALPARHATSSICVTHRTIYGWHADLRVACEVLRTDAVGKICRSERIDRNNTSRCVVLLRSGYRCEPVSHHVAAPRTSCRSWTPAARGVSQRLNHCRRRLA